MEKLDAANVPNALLPILPMAEKWGMGDDFERENEVANAREDELIELVHCIDDITDKELYGWLAGPDSHNPRPSREYLAFTNLTLAIDAAKLKLKKRPTQ